MPFVSINLQDVPWDSLFYNQGGHGKFIGIPRQRGGMRGRGLGGILASIIGMIPTFLRSAIGREVLSTGKNIVSDVIAGEKITDTAKRHGRQAVRNLTGLGRARRKPRRTSMRLARRSLKAPIGVLQRHSNRNTRVKRSVLLDDAATN